MNVTGSQMNDATTTLRTIGYEEYDPAEYSIIPDYTLDSIRRYVEYGVKPGEFLQAVLTNNLREAIGRADENNQYALKEIVQFLYNYVPGNCWGNAENVKAWIERGGIKGQKDES